jgi:hypothetical protein
MGRCYARAEARCVRDTTRPDPRSVRFARRASRAHQLPEWARSVRAVAPRPAHPCSSRAYARHAWPHRFGGGAQDILHKATAPLSAHRRAGLGCRANPVIDQRPRPPRRGRRSLPAPTCEAPQRLRALRQPVGPARWRSDRQRGRWASQQAACPPHRAAARSNRGSFSWAMRSASRARRPAGWPEALPRP